MQTETVDLEPVGITVAANAGPRILGYARSGGPQLFASLPGEGIDSATGRFAFLGGHRLWRAPEIPAITYEPDDRAVGIEHLDDGIRLSGPQGIEGLAKTIELRHTGTRTVVDHCLHNRGARTVRCAAWAITQLVPGGTAILPQPSDPADAAGVLPNRTIVLWPYTDPSDPEIRLGRTELQVEASASETPSKLGQANRRGWMAYLLDGELFVKWSPLHDDSAEYADLGASIECYRDHRFLELESLGPLTDIEPGGELGHREVWELIPLGGRPVEDVLASLPEQPAEMNA